MSDYPKWKYAIEGRKLVKDAEEEKALGEGWYDHPNLSFMDGDKPAVSLTGTQSVHVVVEYPKWVGGKIVKNAVEEAALADEPAMESSTIAGAPLPELAPEAPKEEKPKAPKASKAPKV